MIFTLKLTSDLPLSMETVWQKVSTMEGVNDELMPLLYMTTPTDLQRLPFIEAPVHQVLFPSWLLLFGWIPFDRHYLQLEQVWEGGFLENSHSLVHCSWQHERSIVHDNGGSILSDTLNFEPYITSGASLWF